MKTLPSQERLHELFEYRNGQLIRLQCKYAPQYIGKPAGAIEGRGYLQASVDGQSYQVHRLVWKHVTGKDPADQLDHINGDKLDNRIENLEEVDNRENCARSHQGRELPTGVTLYKRGHYIRYTARIRKNGVKQFLGYFMTPEEASTAYQEAKA